MYKKIIILVILFFLVIPLVTFAGDTVPADGGDTTVSISDPLNGATPNKLIGRLISAMLGIVGSLALLMFIYGGFTWMLAAGNSEAVAKGKNILIWATLGLVVIFTSYTLIQFVFTSIGVT